MKRLIFPIFSFITIVLVLFFSSIFFNVQGSDNYDNSSFDAVYFGSRTCSVCQNLEEDGVIELLKSQGYQVAEYYLEDANITKLLRDYQFTYEVNDADYQVPVLFVGPIYFVGREAINNGILSGDVQNIINTDSLLSIQSAPPSDFSLIYLILLGLVDGINPCAIAILLMFISLLGFTSDKKILVKVSLTFIAAIFISYFLFGTIFYKLFSELGSPTFLVEVIPWIIIGIASFLFLLNLYDFIVTSFQQYGKVKNQLPKGIQKFNKKLIASFTKKMEEGSPLIYVITFMIGIIISFTEFLCTGQAYFTAILHLIHYTDYIGRGIVLLLFYNLIFVLPLIIIAFIAIKSQSITPIASFMREHLNLIKLFNALVFLAIILYYIFVII